MFHSTLFLTVRFTPSEDFCEGGDRLHRLSEDTGRGQPIFTLNYCNYHNSGFKMFQKLNYLDHPHYTCGPLLLDFSDTTRSAIQAWTITLNIGSPSAGAVATELDSVTLSLDNLSLSTHLPRDPGLRISNLSLTNWTLWSLILYFSYSIRHEGWYNTEGEESPR